MKVAVTGVVPVSQPWRYQMLAKNKRHAKRKGRR